MTTKSEKALLKSVMRAHREKWSAPIGQRKCIYRISEDCLGIDDEAKFIGHKCHACCKLAQRERYHTRMKAIIKARGYPKQRPGPKKKVTKEDSESE